ncbi:15889_t:CDS:2 [Acaulospora colombiana]|uniref:15889_t:CDS:1 n=1 Tax=Acaulospora colombiana TaxID=27376 RepID=A0ACA9M4R9_9GLOM|nr:15889_t:CDS:2 [Acaulospora colombiana]
MDIFDFDRRNGAQQIASWESDSFAKNFEQTIIHYHIRLSRKLIIFDASNAKKIGVDPQVSDIGRGTFKRMIVTAKNNKGEVIEEELDNNQNNSNVRTKIESKNEKDKSKTSELDIDDSDDESEGTDATEESENDAAESESNNNLVEF